jgi:N-methylhydantoinase A
MHVIGVDIGGTFTDFMLLDQVSGQIYSDKVLSTKNDPSQAVINYFSSKQSILETTDFFIHGTTVATNAVVEGKGAKIGLLVTKGQLDRIEIQRTNLTELYNFFYKKPKPLVTRRFRREINERVNGKGELLSPINEHEVIEKTKELLDLGIEIIVISYLNSYANDINEITTKNIIKENFSHIPTICSSEVLPEILEYERASTTLIGAFSAPIMNDYLNRLETGLIANGLKGKLLIMQGNGGIMTTDVARQNPVTTLSSGPAAGVIGSAYLASICGHDKIITLDVGGTSTDVSLIKQGEPEVTLEYQLDRRPMRCPLIDIQSIGAGGGSIAWVDEGGGLHVGPQSAGSDPGPACYGLGGKEPTISDAHALLGRLSNERPLGGKIKIQETLSKEAISIIANYYSMTEVEAAVGILKIANTNMANAIKVISLERGLDPRNYMLFVFGGAGPLHGTMVAKELGISKILIPLHPGTHCAFGLICGDLRHDYVKSIITPIADSDPETLEDYFMEMEEKGLQTLLSEGVKKLDIEFKRFCDMRYVGQAYVPVSVPFEKPVKEKDFQKIAELYNKMHQDLYKHSEPNEPLELISLRVVATGRRPKVDLKLDIAKSKNTNPCGSRKVFFEDLNRFVVTPTFWRSNLVFGNAINGPAIIDQLDSTILIYTNQKAELDEYGNIIVTNQV